MSSDASIEPSPAQRAHGFKALFTASRDWNPNVDGRRPDREGSVLIWVVARCECDGCSTVETWVEPELCREVDVVRIITDRLTDAAVAGHVQHVAFHDARTEISMPGRCDEFVAGSSCDLPEGHDGDHERKGWPLTEEDA